MQLREWPGTANQFGIANTKTSTRKPLIVRLQAPRFFVIGDKSHDFRSNQQQHRQSIKRERTLDATGLNSSNQD